MIEQQKTVVNIDRTDHNSAVVKEEILYMSHSAIIQYKTWSLCTEHCPKIFDDQAKAQKPKGNQKVVGIKTIGKMQNRQTQKDRPF